MTIFAVIFVYVEQTRTLSIQGPQINTSLQQINNDKYRNVKMQRNRLQAKAKQNQYKIANTFTESEPTKWVFSGIMNWSHITVNWGF